MKEKPPPGMGPGSGGKANRSEDNPLASPPFHSRQVSAPAKRPISVHPYFDRVHGWLEVPATKSEQAYLESYCGKGGAHFEDKNRRLGQRIDLKQPDELALQWLAARDDAFLNITEIALDLCFANFADRDAVWTFMARHLIRRWHGRTQCIHFVGTGGDVTRYDGPPWAANLLVLYRESECRNTGELEVPVLHLEWRCNRARAVRAAGIITPADLLIFDFNEFWRERLLLVDLDPGKFGRALRNAYGCVWRRPDSRLGEAFLNLHGTIQQALDHARHTHARRLVRVIDNTPFLPSVEAHSLSMISMAELTTFPKPLVSQTLNSISPSFHALGQVKPDPSG